jgi:response regulator RpfG family c-di-GMP phosphodiesterase
MAANAVEILVVDDSKTIRSMLKRELEQIGAAIFQAGDGIEGFKLAVTRHFDLIICDSEMPRLDGFGLCDRLKVEPATRSTPVIILSNSHTEKDIERSFQVGASAFVTKSRLGCELLPRVTEILNRSNVIRNNLYLVVDDSPMIRSTIGDSLAKAGFKVLVAENGQKALEMLGQHKPDIILSDIQMPVMDGAALCAAIRAREDFAGVPFVAMSPESDRRIMQEMIPRGASAFLVKPFQTEELVTLSEKLLSDQFRLLLKKKELLAAERDSLLGGIAGLVQVLETREGYTQSHSEIVAEISLDIARVLGVPPHGLEKLELAAKLHDIGKIGIRENILLKPGGLSDDEFAIVKRHPIVGADILKPISSMAELIPAILYHHEKMDGSGYPHGLKGDSIPLWARIISVADVYQALTSDRPYRGALSPKTALNIIREASGSHLCPACVNAFLIARGYKPDTLAVASITELTPAVTPARDAAVAPAASRAVALKQARILVVDKNRTSLWAMKKAFRDVGNTEFVSAEDGQAAWAIINTKPFDLVVCDWEVPLLSGSEVLEKMRWSEAYSSLPFIMTFSPDLKDKFLASRAQVSAYLIKPFSMNTLIDTVEKVLSASSAESVPQGAPPAASAYPKKLVDAILKCHEQFCLMLAGRFRSSLEKLECDRATPDALASLDACCAAFEGELKKLHIDHYTKKAIDAVRGILSREDSSPGPEMGSVINVLSDGFTAQGKDLFQIHAQNFLSSHLNALGLEGGLDHPANEFNNHFAATLNLCNLRLVKIFDLSLAYKKNGEPCSLQPDEALEKGIKTNIFSFKMVDAFGRGLLGPLELYSSIGDVEIDGHHRRNVFPRGLCSSLLRVIRIYFIGEEKYEKVNSVLLDSIVRNCKSDNEFNSEEFKSFFSHPKIKSYITVQLLNLLKILSSDVKKEQLVSRINDDLALRYADSKYIFNANNYKILTNSWAMFVFHNMAGVTSSKGIMKIIRHYLPHVKL